MTGPDITNLFKKRLSERRPIFGTWLMSTASSTAEALGHLGFDFLVVDMEHTPIETPDLAHILRAIQTTPAAAVPRLAWNDPVMIKRAMDSGAQTLMLPFVQTAEEAAAGVRAALYPPEGTRGVAGVHRGSRYGSVPDYFRRANAEACVIVQIETPQALAALDEIAATPGLGGVFVGPADLSASMGRLGEMTHPDVQNALRDAAEKTRRAGVPIGIVGPTPEFCHRCIDYGYDFVAIASDLGMMTSRAREWLQALGEAPVPAGVKVGR